MRPEERRQVSVQGFRFREGRWNTAWVKISGMKRGLQYEWPVENGKGVRICNHPLWKDLSREEQKELALLIWEAVVRDPRYWAYRQGAVAG